MRRPSSNRQRTGAALVEAALVTTVFLALVLGAVDLGGAVFRWHVLSEAARIGVRQAIVHGQNATAGWKGGPWGPSTYGPVAANASDPKAQAIAPYLAGMDPAAVNVTMSWPDSSNAVEKRVQVSLTSTWTPIMGFLFGSPTVRLRASSMMQIAH
jgi:Flp pilus assembly protein TadG